MPGGEPVLHPEADPDVFIDDGEDYDDDPKPSPKRSRPPPPPPPSGGVPSSGGGTFFFGNADDCTFVGDCDDEDDPPTFVNNGDFGPELSPLLSRPKTSIPTPRLPM